MSDDHMNGLMNALEAAEIRLADAKATLRGANERLHKYGLSVFKAELESRGIVEGSQISIEGRYSGGWGGVTRTMKHDSTPVILRSVSVDSAPWTNPPPHSTVNKWWFRVVIARMKKDGTARDEYRNTLFCGMTPEDAAREVQKP